MYMDYFVYIAHFQIRCGKNSRGLSTDPGEVAETVWTQLPEKVQRVAETESGTKKGIQTLLERQTADISAADDALGKQLVI